MALFDLLRSAPEAESLRKIAEIDPEAACEHLEDLLWCAHSDDPQEQTHVYRALAAVGEARPDGVAEHEQVLHAGLTDDTTAVRAAAAAAIATLPYRREQRDVRRSSPAGAERYRG